MAKFQHFAADKPSSVAYEVREILLHPSVDKPCQTQRVCYYDEIPLRKKVAADSFSRGRNSRTDNLPSSCGRYYQTPDWNLQMEAKQSLPSFICPRVLSFGTADGFRFSIINRNLLSEFEACDGVRVGSKELMKVYLRLRPLKPANTAPESKPALKCLDEHTVVASAPDSQKPHVRESKKTLHNFAFTRVFDSPTNQGTIFDVVASGQVQDFLRGINGLIFAYGTTSSGKTHTLQGSMGDHGMIPRALNMIFHSVKQATDLKLAPKDFSDFSALTVNDVGRILKEKDSLLKLATSVHEGSLNSESIVYSCQPGHKLSDEDPRIDTPYIGHPNLKTKSSTGRQTNLMFTFWISFAEIYNEVVFDLLDPSQCACINTAFQLSNSSRLGPNAANTTNPFSCGVQTSGSCDPTGNRLRKKPLDLRTDKNGNIFIKGLRSYPVNSVDEALRLISVGRQCQRVAATKLNQASSRSHSILTIKAVRVVDTENPCFARISSLTFCDLAGSERTEKAATGGHAARIREASNINASLLTLGRCIECLRYNQLHPDNPKIVPYRDSKLTRLFQGFFTGRGKACMIVNASPNPDLFDETLHALRFSALAKRIIVESNLVVDATVPSKNVPQRAAGNNQHHGKRPMVQKITTTRSPVTRTPATVVPKRAFPPAPASTKDLEVSSELPDGEEESTVTLEYEDGDIKETSVDAPSSVTLTSPHTPVDSGVTDLILDDYTREELMSMVKELSEQLFESKAELAEQDYKLRQEMCEALNQQMVEFERLYKESWSFQEKLMTEEWNRRIQDQAERASKRRDRGRKRCRRSQSDESSEDETSCEERSAFLEISQLDSRTQSLFHDSMAAGDAPSTAVQIHPQNLRIVDVAAVELKEAQERIADLESELADQRDVIENLSKERDGLRVDNTRLEFKLTLLPKQIEADKKIQQRNTVVDASTETDSLKLMDKSCSTSSLDTNCPPVNKSFNDTSLLEDSAVVVHLPKSIEARNVWSGGGCKYFDPYVSPEQQLRLMKSENAGNPTKTPVTVVKAKDKTAHNSDSARAMLEDEKVDRLREENQILLARLGQMRVCVQRAIQEKRDTELELTRLQNVSEINTGDRSRLSEGLQSFLEHESRLHHMETMETLRQQIYDLEEQFATKHDALLRSEEAYAQIQTERNDLSERVLAQAEELGHLHQNISTIKRHHKDELESIQRRLIREKEDSLEGLRKLLEEKLKMEHNRVLELEAHIPENDIAIQTMFDVVENDTTAVQTSVLVSPKLSDIYTQVSPARNTKSVGLQTSLESLLYPGLCSPIHAPDQRPACDLVEAGTIAQPTALHVSSDTCLANNLDVEQTMSADGRKTRNLRSTVTSKPQRVKKGRRTKKEKIPIVPKLQPISQISLLSSDSGEEISTVHKSRNKENCGAITDHCSNGNDEYSETNDEANESCTSEPVQHTRTCVEASGRRTRSTSQRTRAPKDDPAPPPRVRTRSANAGRRLPPLAESTQLIPDSFFQDELDSLIDQLDADHRRDEERPNLRQGLRKPPRRQR
ncbi:unnamed protein product [Calicophoron daubneyi]|uniref:Kinesin motor domain-containing protein n=1 Tax=Calicophoron daubneyi TaxID=300641 RepID=A0AAV2TMS5_CALDB